MNPNPERKQRRGNIHRIPVLMALTATGAAISSLCLAAQETSHYVKPTQVCADADSSKLESNNKYNLPIILNQGNYGTCYGFSSYFLLQYFNAKESPGSDPLSILDVLGQGCRKEFREGGRQFATLFNIREEKGLGMFRGQEPFQYDKLFKNRMELENYGGTCDPKRIQECCAFIKREILAPPAAQSVKNTEVITNLLTHVSAEAPHPDQHTFAFRLMDRLRQGPKKKLQPFNISVVEPKNTNDALEKLKDHFASADPSPVGLSFCPESKNGECTGRHAVVIAGVRKNCGQDEWNLINSYGDGKENENSRGWMRADQLANYVRGGHVVFTSVSRCYQKTEPQEPKCKEFFDSANNLNHLILTGNVQKTRDYFEERRKNRQLLDPVTLKSGLMTAVNSNYKEMIEYFTEEMGVHPDFELQYSDGTKLSPLEAAIASGDRIAVDTLLKLGSDPLKVYPGKKAPLELAFQKAGESKDKEKLYEPIIALLKTHAQKKQREEHLAAINKKDSAGYTPLMRAVEGSDVASVETLLEEGAHIDEQNYLNQTALYLAASRGNLPMVKLLLNWEANLEIPGLQNKTPLHAAVESDHPEVVLQLLKVKANLRAKTTEGDSLIHLAALNNSVASFQVLLDWKADVHEENKDGWTPLAIAASRGKREMVEALLEHGADLNWKNKKGESALTQIESSNRKDMIAFIQEKTRELGERKFSAARAKLNTPNEQGFTALHLAIREEGPQALAKVRQLISQGANPNVANSAGQTPFYLMAKAGNIPMMEALLEAKPDAYRKAVDIEQADPLDRTPLFAAVSYCQPEAVQFLIRNGAKIDNPQHPVPLLVQAIEAYTAKTPATVRVLLDGGADPRRMVSNKTILSYVKDLVREDPSDKIARQVLDLMNEKLDEKMKRTLSLKDKNGHNLDTAIEANDLVALQALLQAGADQDGLLHGGESPLTLAIKRNKPELVDLLLKKQANPSLPNLLGIPPLCQASLIGNVKVAESLIRAGANPNVRDEKGNSALSHAITNGHDELTYLLINKGASIREIDSEGNSLLALAILTENEKLAGYLINKGLDLDQTNYEGQSILQLAKNSGSNSLLQLIQEAKQKKSMEVPLVQIQR